MGNRPPLSSKSPGKGGGSEKPPAPETPMERFKRAAKLTINADRMKVIAAERRLAAAAKMKRSKR